MLMLALTITAVAVYLGSGLLGSCLAYAYLQREFPRIADDGRREDTVLTLVTTLLGPMNLAAVFIMTSFNLKHGLLLPGRRP